MTIKIRPGRNGKLEVDISVLLPSGVPKRIRRASPVPSRSGTQRWAEERIRHLLAAPPEPTKTAPTLAAFEDEYINYCRAQRQKESWIEFKRSVYRNWLVKLLGDVPLNEISDVKRQQLELALAKHSIEHRNNVLNVLATTLETAKKEFRYIDALPCSINMIKRKRKEMGFHEISIYERLVAAAAEIDTRTLIVVLLGGDAGLRIGEIVELKKDWIDFARNVITVKQRNYRGVVDVPKGREKNNKVIMSGRLATVLKTHRSRGAHVLQRDENGPITRRIASRWIEHAEALAGLPVTGRLHVLRHTFASHLAMAGAAPSVIQSLAGHADLQTTQRYIHLAEGVGKSAIQLLEQSRSRVPTSSEVVDLIE